jgi:hypothetical protein
VGQDAAEVRRLLASVQALATLGAELWLRQDRLEAHPLVGERLGEAVRAIHPDLPDCRTTPSTPSVAAFGPPDLASHDGPASQRAAEGRKEA